MTMQVIKNHRKAGLRYRYHQRCRTIEGEISGLSMANQNDRRILSEFVKELQTALKKRW